ncbi:type II secretion system protein [Planctomycetota bacterium]
MFISRRIHTTGFTLIELLVVISIICILMAILLPSLSSARQQGKRVACSANFKGLYEAWLMYAFDNDDRLCSANTDWNLDMGHHWVADGPELPDNITGGSLAAITDGVLWPYVGKAADIYRCQNDQTELQRSYSLARSMNGKTCNCEHDDIHPFKLWSQIRRPAEKLVFIDATSRTQWIEGSFCAVADIDAVPAQWFNRASRNITARHLNGCNIVLADGHHEYWKYGDHRTVDLANWEMTAEDASPDNPDLHKMVYLLEGRKEE